MLSTGAVADRQVVAVVVAQDHLLAVAGNQAAALQGHLITVVHPQTQGLHSGRR